MYPLILLRFTFGGTWDRLQWMQVLQNIFLVELSPSMYLCTVCLRKMSASPHQVWHHQHMLSYWHRVGMRGCPCHPWVCLSASTTHFTQPSLVSHLRHPPSLFLKKLGMHRVLATTGDGVCHPAYMLWMVDNSLARGSPCQPHFICQPPVSHFTHFPHVIHSVTLPCCIIHPHACHTTSLPLYHCVFLGIYITL